METEFSFKAPEVLANQIDAMIKEGYYKNNKEVMNEAFRLLVRKYKAVKARERIAKLAEKTKGVKVNLTKAVIQAHEEEEEL